jgi:hypothetical protein
MPDWLSLPCQIPRSAQALLHAQFREPTSWRQWCGFRAEVRAGDPSGRYRRATDADLQDRHVGSYRVVDHFERSGGRLPRWLSLLVPWCLMTSAVQDDWSATPIRREESGGERLNLIVRLARTGTWQST